MFEGWAAAAAVVGSAVVGGAINASAAGSAASAQANAANNAQQISQQEFNTVTAQNAPFMESGYGALSALDYGLGITPQNSAGNLVTYPTGSPNGPQGYDPSSGYQMGGGGGISQLIPNLGMGALGGSGIPISAQPSVQTPSPQTGGLGFGSLTKPFNVSDWQQLSPAYNFQLQQGRQGVLNADTSGQGALSGSAMKDLIDYNQSAANTSFNSAFNQYQTQQGNIFSRLSGIAQLGQAAANNTGQQGTALAGQAAQSATNIGTAQAGGIVGSANAISGGISSAVPWLYANQGSSPAWSGSGGGTMDAGGGYTFNTPG
jgi:hypothetical protein